MNLSINEQVWLLEINVSVFVNEFQMTSFWWWSRHKSVISGWNFSVKCYVIRTETFRRACTILAVFFVFFWCGSMLDHRSLPYVFESRPGHIWRVFHLWLRFITFGGRSAHLAYHVHTCGHKTSIIIILVPDSSLYFYPNLPWGVIKFWDTNRQYIIFKTIWPEALYSIYTYIYLCAGMHISAYVRGIHISACVRSISVKAEEVFQYADDSQGL